MKRDYPFQREYGEVVSAGHPDKLADAIADTIVATVAGSDPGALVGVEVATALNRVFVTGRVASTRRVTAGLDLKGIVRGVYRAAGYGTGGPGVTWAPDPGDVLVDESGLVRDEIGEDERGIRHLSDDQSVTVGYAVDSPGTNYIPRAQWLAWQVMHHIRLQTAQRRLEFGPDAKVLTEVSSRGRRWALERLVVSMQHAPSTEWTEAARIVYTVLDRLRGLFAETGVGCDIDPDAVDLVVNGHGDFSTGGPMGDNGLSGKKLVMDAYGPMVPIGGGAYSGKDPHKVDRAGAVLAREMALRSVIWGGSPWALVHLAWAPGRPGYVSVRSTAPDGIEPTGLPETIAHCVGRYFPKKECASLAERALKGWYSGFRRAPWEALIPPAEVQTISCHPGSGVIQAKRPKGFHEMPLPADENRETSR